MRRWLIPCAVLLLAAPALAQTGTPPSSDTGAGAMQPDVTGRAPKVDAGRGADVKSRTPSGDTSAATRSGSPGISGDRALGASKAPPDDSADAYKKDFQKK